MKVYVGGTSEEVCGACVANSAKEAKAMLWNDSDVRDACDGDYYNLRVRRSRQHDSVAREYQEPVGVIRGLGTLRAMGFLVDGDPACVSCGLYTMDGEFPLCPDCGYCEDCGHAEDVNDIVDAEIDLNGGNDDEAR